MRNLIEFGPHYLLGQCEGILDALHARALSRSPIDEGLLVNVERLRELHRQLNTSLQKQRLLEQLEASAELTRRVEKP